MNVYLAGPMRGFKDYNFPAFYEAGEELRAMGHVVFSPAEKDNEKHGSNIFKGPSEGQDTRAESGGFNLREALAMDLTYICSTADAVCFLRGWELSKGARAESAAAIALGLRRYIQTDTGWLEVDDRGLFVTAINGSPEKLRKDVKHAKDNVPRR